MGDILSLANNERIPLKTHIRNIYEIKDLRFATPARLSRTVILYIYENNLYDILKSILCYFMLLFNIDFFIFFIKKHTFLIFFSEII